LMTHWRSVLPRAPLEVSYEYIVSDTEHEVRSLLAYCDLAWEDTCIVFHKSKRSVKTPSRWQVRQPIYGTSVRRSENYERHLAPLRGSLVSVLSEGDRGLPR